MRIAYWDMEYLLHWRAGLSGSFIVTANDFPPFRQPPAYFRPARDENVTFDLTPTWGEILRDPPPAG